ncbi:MAG TPA: hypothetical protein VF020_07180 [Chthoniobacterales bacterium]
MSQPDPPSSPEIIAATIAAHAVLEAADALFRRRFPDSGSLFGYYQIQPRLPGDPADVESFIRVLLDHVQGARTEWLSQLREWKRTLGIRVDEGRWDETRQTQGTAIGTVTPVFSAPSDQEFVRRARLNRPAITEMEKVESELNNVLNNLGALLSNLHSQRVRVTGPSESSQERRGGVAWYLKSKGRLHSAVDKVRDFVQHRRHRGPKL